MPRLRVLALAACAFVIGGSFEACSSGGSGNGGTSSLDGGDGGGGEAGAGGPAACPRFAWVSRISGGGDDAPNGVAELEDGTIAVGGSVDRGAIFGVGGSLLVRAERPAAPPPDAGTDSGIDAGDPGDAGDAGAPIDAGPLPSPWSPYLGFVATYDRMGGFSGALVVSALEGARVSVVSVAPRPGGNVAALVTVQKENQTSPAQTAIAFASGSDVRMLSLPSNSVVLLETDAHAAYRSARTIALGGRDGRIVALPDGGFAVAIPNVNMLDFDTPQILVEQNALVIARYDAAGTRRSAHVVRPSGGAGFYRVALATRPSGDLLFAGSCVGDFIVDATGPTPAPITCQQAGIVTVFAADESLAFVKPISVADTNPSVAGVFDDHGTTWVHVMRGTGAMAVLDGYDAKGELKSQLFEGDSNFSAPVSLLLGGDLVRFGQVAKDRSRVAGSAFGVDEPALVMTRGRGTKTDWARLLGPSPGQASVALASGDDVILAGTFSDHATFGVDSKARTIPAAGGNDIFVSRVIVDGSECIGRANDAGFPNNPEPLVCNDGVDDFHTEPKTKTPFESFDWNCDGVEEHELQGINYDCSWSSLGCPPPGWVVHDVPRCGESALYSDCKSNGAYSCASNWSTRVQRCK